VFEANNEENGNRKFILIQLPEPCSKESEAYNSGFKTIADIGKERIRKLGKKISGSNKTLNIGFKIFKLNESNFKIWRSDYKSGKELEKQLEMFVDNVQRESTQENILYELILKSGLDLNVKIENKEWKKNQYFSVDSGKLIVFLEDKISKDFIDHVIDQKPLKVICLDRAFAGNDQLKTNTHLQMESAKIDFKVI